MIDERELRKYNYVAYEDGSIQCIQNGWEIDEGNELFGIPLDLEWMIKFGFHSDQGDELGVYRTQIGNNLDFMVNLLTGEAGFSMGWRNDFCSVWKKVKYVHEVHNIIYFLSNEELEVK